MIPKVIHYCWFGRNPIPAELEGYISSWKRIMPDYEIKLWNEDNYDVNKCAYMKEAYEAGKWGFVPDYARLDILYSHGGIYMDTDVEAVRAFDSLLGFEAFCGFEEGRQKEPYCMNFGLGFGCEAGCRIIKTVMDSYNSLHFMNPDGSLNMIASPGINTKLLMSYGLKPDNTRQNIGGLEVFPTEYFCPVNQYTGKENITGNTFSIHHYSATWMNPADQERRKLRAKFSYLGNTGSEIAGSFIAYRKHYGLAGMWKHIAEKLRKRITKK